MDDLSKLWLFVPGIAFVLACGWVGWQVGGHRRRQRPKPPPASWWLCPDCRSVNEPDQDRCYSCARARPGDAAILPTDPEFHLVQAFGPRRWFPRPEPLASPDEVERIGEPPAVPPGEADSGRPGEADSGA